MVEHRGSTESTPPKVVPERPRPRPFLAPPQPESDYVTSGSVRPSSASIPQLASVHFFVHPEMNELRAYAQARGWTAQGFTQLSIDWQELHWTTDGWKTKHVLASTDVPCPVVDGFFFVPGVAPGAEVEFAVRVGVACHAPQDTAGSRDTGEVWFNNAGANYRQTTR